jgi:hypothetical protein
MALHAVTYIRKKLHLENPQSATPASKRETRRGASSMIDQAAISWYSVTLHDRITAREYVDWLGSQEHPMI